jgi:hypothetical protein
MVFIARSGSDFFRRAKRLMFGSVATVLLSMQCFSQSAETTCGQELNELVEVRGQVVDAKTNAPVANADVHVELCGIYTGNPDSSKGHPNYRGGARTNANGEYSFLAPKGPFGLHVFQSGYRYGPLLIPEGGHTVAQNVRMEPQLPFDKVPTVTKFAASSSTVRPGARFTLSASVNASSAKDPLSEEVLVLEPVSSLGRAMNPPRRGVQGKGYPDGTWTLEVTAPKTPGAYEYAISVSSEMCITSAREVIAVTVAP